MVCYGISGVVNLNFPRHFAYRNHTLFVQRLHACARKMPSCSLEVYMVSINLEKLALRQTVNVVTRSFGQFVG